MSGKRTPDIFGRNLNKNIVELGETSYSKQKLNLHT